MCVCDYDKSIFVVSAYYMFSLSVWGSNKIENIELVAWEFALLFWRCGEFFFFLQFNLFLLLPNTQFCSTIIIRQRPSCELINIYLIFFVPLGFFSIHLFFVFIFFSCISVYLFAFCEISGHKCDKINF